MCIASRNKNDGEKISKRLKCDFIQADLSTEDGCENLANEFKRRYEYLDVLINNSGVAWGEPFESHSEKVFTKRTL